MFKKYNSITNSYKIEFVNKIKNNFPDEKFCVTEKLNGANMSISIVGNNFTLNRRNAPLNGEKFYSSDSIDFQSIVDKLLKFTNHVDVIVYGELIGGDYPHPEVDKSNDCCIQKGVYYSPKNEFVIFDIYDCTTEKFINYAEVRAVCQNIGLNSVPILEVGTLEKCLEYPNEFQTWIPKELGYPEIENNICEGVVIKPYKDLYLNNGDRAILKNKNTKFSEKQKVFKPKIVELSEKDNADIAGCAELINKNRLDCVLSKLGQPNIKQFGMITGLLTKDVLDEYGDVSQAAKKEVNKMCAALLRENLNALS